MNSLFLPPAAARAYVAALCFMPLIAMATPRFTGWAPALIALCALGAYYAAHKTLPVFSRRVLAWALLFPVLMVCSALWSVAPEVSLTRAVKTLPIVLSGAVLWTLAATLDAQSLNLFRKYFPLAVIAAGMVIAAELYAHGPVYKLLHPGTDADLSYNPSPLNRSVVIYVLCAFIAFFCLQERVAAASRKEMLPVIVLAFTTGLILFATSSQSAQLAFILGAVFYACFLYRSKIAWGVLGTFVAALLVATPWLAQLMFTHLAQSQMTEWLNRGYASHRLEIWDFVSRRALERPFIGHGAEAAREIKDFDSAGLYWPTTKVHHPHNFAVQIWIEFGLIGALLTTAFLADLLRHIRGLGLPFARMGLSLFIVSLSIAATGYGLWQGWWLGLFCLIFGYAGIVLRKTN